MDEFVLVMFFCGGPLFTLVAIGAGAAVATANSRRRREIEELRDQLQHLQGGFARLAQHLSALEARPPLQAPAPTPTAEVPSERVPTQPWSGEPARGQLETSTPEQAATPEGTTPLEYGASSSAQPEPAPPLSSEPEPQPEPEPEGVEEGASAGQSPPAAGPAAPPSTFPVSGPAPAAQPAKGPGLEEWLGVRGIALLGALTLVVAGVYFFRYSVEHGLITPAMRVILGVVVGLACIGVSEKPLRGRHPLLANFIAGAGVAILYLASWASGALYELVPRPAAFALMSVTTAVCCALALRHKAMSIAMIGLLGGFVTPISLSTGQDRPLALFGYLLFLDLALIAVAHRMRWGVLALLSVLGTFVYQLGWVFGRMGPARVWMGVGIVALFTLVFALATLATSRPNERAEQAEGGLASLVAKATQGLALLLPFLFPFYFVAHADLRMDLLPTLVLLTLLSVGACVMAVATRAYFLQVAAAMAAGVTLLVHVMTTGHATLGWTFGGLVMAVTLTHAGAVEVRARLDRKSGTSADSEDAGSVPGLAFLPSHGFLLFVAAALFAMLLGAARVLPMAGTLSVVVALVAAGRVSAVGGLRFAGTLVAPLGALVLALMHGEQGPRAGGLGERAWLALALLPVAAAQSGAFARALPTRRALDHGAGLAALVFAGHLVFLSYRVPATVPLYVLAAVTALALVLLPLARSGVGAYFGPVVLALAAYAAEIGQRASIRESAGLWLACLVAIAGSATVLPMLVLGARARLSRGLYRGSAMAMPLFFPAILGAYREVFGVKSDGIPALLAGVVVVLSLAVARRRAPEPVRISASAWPAAAALGFVTLAIPLQVENEWVTVGWALLGAALLGLFRRIDHAGLKYIALAHFAAVALRLLANPYVLEYHPVSTWPIVNWLAYTYLVPVLAALLGAAWLRDIEVPRWRKIEASIMPAPIPVFANALGVLAVALGFAWINLTIIDAFAPHGPLELDLDRRPARDLTLSLAWALYGAVLLGIGMWRKSTALRGLSLGLVMLTIGKVFLVDLGNLQDLYRVASLVGLAISLLVISLAYRRFVFPASDTGSQEGNKS